MIIRNGVIVIKPKWGIVITQNWGIMITRNLKMG